MSETDVQRVRDEEHLRILGILNYVAAGLFGLVALSSIPFVAMMTSHRFESALEHARAEAVERSMAHGQDPVFDAAFGHMETFLWVFVGIWVGVVILAAVLSFLNGRYLRRTRHPTFSTVVAALQCLMVPLGTVLGVFTLIVLGRPTVRDKYDQARGEPGYSEGGFEEDG